MELTPLSSMPSLPVHPGFGMFRRRSQVPKIGLLIVERAGGGVVRQRCPDRDLDRIAQRERNRANSVQTITSGGTEVRYQPRRSSVSMDLRPTAALASRTRNDPELTPQDRAVRPPDFGGNRSELGCVFDRFREAHQWREAYAPGFQRTEGLSIEIPEEIVDMITGALRQVTNPSAPVHGHARDVTSKVLVETQEGIASGSGWPVAPGQLVTNAHVAGVGDRDVSVEGESGLLDASVAHSDPAQDVALLNVPELDVTPLPLADHDPAPGTPGVMLGYGHGGPLLERPVTVTGKVPAQDGWPRALVLDECPIPGDSGGPIVDYRGQVIGMTVGGDFDDPHVGYALPPTAIQQVIGGNAPRQAAVDGPGVDREDTTGGGIGSYQREPAWAPRTYQWNVLERGELGPWMSADERAARDHDELGMDDHEWIVGDQEWDR